MKKRRTKPTLRAQREEMIRTLSRANRTLEGYFRKDRKRVAKYGRNNPQMHVVALAGNDFTGYDERMTWVLENVKLGTWIPLTHFAVAFQNICDAIHYKLRFVG